MVHVNLGVTFIGNNDREEERKGASVFLEVLSFFWNQFFNLLAMGFKRKSLPSDTITKELNGKL